jgi:hypothetical protein
MPVASAGEKSTHEMVSEMSHSAHSRWIYLLPTLHLCVCLISMVGYLVPRLQYLGIVWTGIMVADFPISLVALVLAWKYSALATAWILVVGTLWWYLLSRGAELVARRFKPHRDVPLNKPGTL